MIVKRIVSNVAASNPDDARIFYESIFDLALVMDHGWIKTRCLFEATILLFNWPKPNAMAGKLSEPRSERKL